MATILLMSLSGIWRAQATAAKAGQEASKQGLYEMGRNDAEFSISDNKRIDYVI